MTEHELRTSLSTGLLSDLVGEVQALDHWQHRCYVEDVGALLNVTIQNTTVTSTQHRIHLTYQIEITVAILIDNNVDIANKSDILEWPLLLPLQLILI